jgi:hypothetical protein
MPKVGKKSRVVTRIPEVGELVLVKDWANEELTVKIHGFFESPSFGECFNGRQLEIDTHRGRVFSRYVALPLDRIVQSAVLTRIGRGKWDITYPDGTTERVPSIKAAKERAKQHGVGLIGGS